MRAITGRVGLQVPTRPLVRPPHWPARLPRETSSTSPIRLQVVPTAAERAATEDAAAAAARATAKASRTPPPKVADLPLDAIIAAYEAGRSLRDIAAEHGVTRRVISARLKVAGVPLRRPGGQASPDLAGLVTEHGDYVRVAWADPGLSIQQIADRIGVHRDVAKAIARTLGLPPRNRPGTRRSARTGL